MTTPNIGKPRMPGSFSLIPLALFCVVTLMIWWIATQRLAAQLGYQAALGPPGFAFGPVRLYRPWQALTWNYWFHPYAPTLFWQAIKLVYLGPILGVVAVIGYAVWQARRARIATTHGTARWATRREAKRAGLLEGRGVVLGQLPNGQYLQHDGPEHVISIAPTRSGKGVGQIIPTLLTWPESVVVHDFKAENWEATAGARGQFSHCLYFNPVDPRSCHYNPLSEIRPGPDLIKDTQNVAQMIVDPDGKGLADHWTKTAFSLFVATILQVLYCEPEKTLAGIAHFLADPKRDTLTTLRRMRDSTASDPVARRVIQSTAQEMLNKEARELSAVVSTAMSFLSLYRDPIVAANTTDSDFAIVDLLEAEYPVSLYLAVPPSDKARLMPLMRLMWAQIGGRLTERLHGEGRRHRVLLMIDELPSLGKLEFIQSGLAFIAGYGIKAFLIAQSKKQLDEVFGRNHSILDNCPVRTFYTPNDLETAQEISAMLGMTTEVHQQKMYTGHRLAPWLAHVMVADQETARALLTPDEVLRFPDDEAFLFMTGKPALRATKIRYFSDPNFTRRLRPAPTLKPKRPYPYRPAPRPNPWTALAQSDKPTAAQKPDIRSAPAPRFPQGPDASSASPDAQLELNYPMLEAREPELERVPEVLRDGSPELDGTAGEKIEDLARERRWTRARGAAQGPGGPELGLGL